MAPCAQATRALSSAPATCSHCEGGWYQQYLGPKLMRQPLVHLREAKIVAHRQAQPPGRAVARHQPLARRCEPARGVQQARY
jgi:hypothetical protein